MATTIWTDVGHDHQQRWALLHTLRAFGLRYLQQRTNRLELARAGRLGPRLLADMGIDAGEAKALLNDWDDLMPNGYLVRPIR